MDRDSNNRNLIIARVFTNIALFGSVMFSHWIVAVAVAIIGLFLFNKFFEAIVAGFLIDLLYGVQTEKLFDFEYVFLAASVLVFILIQHLKSYLR